MAPGLPNPPHQEAEVVPGEGLGYLQGFAGREKHGAFLAEPIDAGGSELL